MSTSDAAFHLTALWESKKREADTQERLSCKTSKTNRARHELLRDDVRVCRPRCGVERSSSHSLARGPTRTTAARPGGGPGGNMDTQTKRRTLQPYEMGGHPEFGALAQSVNSVQVWFGMAQNTETRDMALRALARDAEKVAEVARAMLAGAANEVTP